MDIQTLSIVSRRLEQLDRVAGKFGYSVEEVREEIRQIIRDCQKSIDNLDEANEQENSRVEEIFEEGVFVDVY